MKHLRIGLTGARGVLGRCLQQDWPEPEWIIFPGDIRRAGEVSAWIESSGPLDAVIHFAAMVPTVKVDQNPHAAFETNVAGTCNLLEAIRTKGQTGCWVFLGSTSHVYASSPAPLAEDAPIRPVSLYGQTKWQAEEWGRIYADRYKLSVCVGRIFSYTSRLQPDSYFVPSLIRKFSAAAPGASLEIPGLHGTRDFLTTGQISRAVRFLCEGRHEGTVNIAAGAGVKLLDLALAVRDRLGREDVRIDAPDVGTAHLCADTRRLRGLGLELQGGIESLVDEMVGEVTS